MRAPRETVNQIHEILNRFSEGYGQKNVDMLMALFAPDPDVTVIGTGENEKKTGREAIRNQFERDFRKSDQLDVEFSNVEVSQQGPVCWVSGDTEVHFNLRGRAVHVCLRFTAVLEKRNNRWQFVQTHFSLPFADSAGD